MAYHVRKSEDLVAVASLNRVRNVKARWTIDGEGRTVAPTATATATTTLSDNYSYRGSRSASRLQVVNAIISTDTEYARPIRC